jgi:hypothetical protein
MTLPDDVQAILPADTAAAWEAIAPAIPEAAYLAGGTGLAVHLHHRVSEDLDFFYHQSAIDLEALNGALNGVGEFAATHLDEHTLNGVFGRTKLQFLHADAGKRPQTLLDEPKTVAGIRIAGIRDLLATKLKVLLDRSELRDYFDLMAIESAGAGTVEVGLQYVVERFQPTHADTTIMQIVRSLGFLEDAEEDLLVPMAKTDIEHYWHRRQPEILRSLSRT